MILETLIEAFYSGLYHAVAFFLFLILFFALLTLGGASLGINKLILKAIKKFIG